MEVKAATLHGQLIRLEPLSLDHVPDLAEAAAHDAIWTYLDEPTPRTIHDVERLVQEALDEEQRGARLPFAIMATDSGRAVGSVSFIDLQAAHRGLEIGWGWITPDRWGSGAMREAAFLLLHYAFEALGAIRVAFKTDVRNLRSQGALAALGATREGTFRRHRILADGYVRDSAYYSITDDEWPAIRDQGWERAGVPAVPAVPETL